MALKKKNTSLIPRLVEEPGYEANEMNGEMRSIMTVHASEGTHHGGLGAEKCMPLHFMRA